MGLMAAGWFPLQSADIPGAGRSSQAATLSMLNPLVEGNPQGYWNLNTRRHEVPGSGEGESLARAELAPKWWDGHRGGEFNQTHSNPARPTPYLHPGPYQNGGWQQSLSGERRRCQGTGEQAA